MFNLVLGGDADLFGSRTGTLFDRTIATETAANIVISSVFSPQRAERLATQQNQNKSLPSLFEVMQSFTNEVILSKFTSNCTYYSGFGLSYVPGLKSGSSSESGSGSGSVSRSMFESSTSDIDYQHVLEEQFVLRNQFVPAADKFLENDRESSDIMLHKEDNERRRNLGDNSLMYILETMVVQSVLVNAYLLLMTNSDSSSRVQGQIRSHLRSLNVKLIKLKDCLQVRQLRSAGAEEYYFEQVAHLELLSDAISSGKPFMKLFPSPLGPPI